MFGSRFKTEACEIQCRLCLGRIKLMRNKKIVQLQSSRKEIANLLKTGKQEYARIRVEGVIREQLMLQAYDILELYVELLAVRAQLVSKTKEIPRDMVEAISSMIYSAQRIGDMPELAKLRGMFESKYGKEYVQEANSEATSSKWQVNQNLIRCLLVEPPSAEEKLSTLSEIAQENGVEWDLSAAARDLLPPAAAPGTVPGGLAAPGPAWVGGSGAPGVIGGAPRVQSGASAASDASWMGGPAAGAGPARVQSGAAAGHYESAGEAAAAAAFSAAQARAAADYAAQFAMQQAGLPPPSESWLLQQSRGGLPGQEPALNGTESPAPVSDGGAPAAGFDGRQTPPSSRGASVSGSRGGSGGGGAAASAGPYVRKSNEDIQRAYDAALGPPSKGALAPSAPTPPPPDHAMPTVPAPLNLPAPPSGLGLPAPPSAAVQPGAPGKPEDEYEALTRRLEALKRS